VTIQKEVAAICLQIISQHLLGHMKVNA